MLCHYQLKIANLYNIPIGNVKKLVPNFFDKEKYVIHYENLQLYLRLGLKLKKIHLILEFSQSQWLKQYVKMNKKRIEAEKKGDKDGKALYKLMINICAKFIVCFIITEFLINHDFIVILYVAIIITYLSVG